MHSGSPWLQHQNLLGVCSLLCGGFLLKETNTISGQMPKWYWFLFISAAFSKITSALSLKKIAKYYQNFWIGILTVSRTQCEDISYLRSSWLHLTWGSWHSHGHTCLAVDTTPQLPTSHLPPWNFLVDSEEETPRSPQALRHVPQRMWAGAGGNVLNEPLLMGDSRPPEPRQFMLPMGIWSCPVPGWAALDSRRRSAWRDTPSHFLSLLPYLTPHIAPFWIK